MGSHTARSCVNLRHMGADVRRVLVLGTIFHAFDLEVREVKGLWVLNSAHSFVARGRCASLLRSFLMLRNNIKEVILFPAMKPQ